MSYSGLKNNGTELWALKANDTRVIKLAKIHFLLGFKGITSRDKQQSENVRTVYGKKGKAFR
jgi:hypothetical protein